MAYEVAQLNPNTWRFADDEARFFLLAGTEKALLIDSGMNVRNAKDIAEGLTGLPVFLLNTHADIDHIGSNEQFDSFYMHPAEEPVYRRSGKAGTIVPVREGDVIDLGQRRLEIIAMPGHTPGSIAVLDVENRVLISGDPIQQNGRILMISDVPAEESGGIYMYEIHRDWDDYLRSLERLEARKAEFDEIWPSHGDFPVSPDVIGKIHDRVQDMLAGKVKGKPAVIFGCQIYVYDLGICGFMREK